MKRLSRQEFGSLADVDGNKWSRVLPQVTFKRKNQDGP